MDATAAPEARAVRRLENIMAVDSNDMKSNVKSVTGLADEMVPNGSLWKCGRGWWGKILNSGHNHVRPRTTSPSRPPIPSRHKSGSTVSRKVGIETRQCGVTIEYYHFGLETLDLNQQRSQRLAFTT